jgi:signal transduction histidine kinase
MYVNSKTYPSSKTVIQNGAGFNTNDIEKIREELLALFSHELKTPLTLITGWCQVLKSPNIVGKLNSEQSHAIDVVSASAVKLRSDIDDILDTNKLIYGTILFSFSNVELDKLILRIIKRIRPVTIEKHVRIVNLAKKKIIIRTDPDRIQQILLNIVLNAIDFVPRNTGVIKIGIKDEDKQIVFFVSDNGSGIQKNNQEIIFEKLVQEDSSYRRTHTGLGLGLFLCKGFIESLGGRIWVKSKVKHGATFYFTHPKYGNTKQFSLIHRPSRTAVSELYNLAEKRMHDQKEQEMVRRLREYVERIKYDDYLTSMKEINGYMQP